MHTQLQVERGGNGWFLTTNLDDVHSAYGLKLLGCYVVCQIDEPDKSSVNRRALLRATDFNYGL
jgi:hypothetical protein